ncbi:hypothetical protein M3175_01370 [Robertmurraya korlensis]|uniref:DUF6906 family protein n=1 Tax=Robertmurraya korlensis TaxID=519977 RepID=UPI00203CCC8A|nr:hypothetical protein [Robertmurraya korlensis]MCM3599364.1 hypothetical protein [Robertmurraya korlensis]
MKSGKKPTRAQRKILLENGLNPLNWLIVKNQDLQMEVVHRETGRLKTLNL